MENKTSAAFGALDISMEPQMAAISKRYASRGIAKAVKMDAGSRSSVSRRRAPLPRMLTDCRNIRIMPWIASTEEGRIL